MGIAGNPVNTDNFKTTFTHFQPEVRYWINRPMVSHFLGVTAFVNNFNMLVKDVHHKGDALAAGLTYGYAWVLGNHWNIEATPDFTFLPLITTVQGAEEVIYHLPAFFSSSTLATRSV